MKDLGLTMTPEEIADLPYRPCVGIMLANPRGHVFVALSCQTAGQGER